MYVSRERERDSMKTLALHTRLAFIVWFVSTKYGWFALIFERETEKKKGLDNVLCVWVLFHFWLTGVKRIGTVISLYFFFCLSKNSSFLCACWMSTLNIQIRVHLAFVGRVYFSIEHISQMVLLQHITFNLSL